VEAEARTRWRAVSRPRPMFAPVTMWVWPEQEVGLRRTGSLTYCSAKTARMTMVAVRRLEVVEECWRRGVLVV
jgi:hypothetical protein